MGKSPGLRVCPLHTRRVKTLTAFFAVPRRSAKLQRVPMSFNIYLVNLGRQEHGVKVLRGLAEAEKERKPHV